MARNPFTISALDIRQIARVSRASVNNWINRAGPPLPAYEDAISRTHYYRLADVVGRLRSTGARKRGLEGEELHQIILTDANARALRGGTAPDMALGPDPLASGRAFIEVLSSEERDRLNQWSVALTRSLIELRWLDAAGLDVDSVLAVSVVNPAVTRFVLCGSDTELPRNEKRMTEWTRRFVDRHAPLFAAKEAA